MLVDVRANSLLLESAVVDYYAVLSPLAGHDVACIRIAATNVDHRLRGHRLASCQLLLLVEHHARSEGIACGGSEHCGSLIGRSERAGAKRVGDGRETNALRRIDASLTCSPAASRDDHNAVRRSRTIDGRGRCALENLDALNVV